MIDSTEYDEIERWADEHFTQGEVAVVMRLYEEFGWRPAVEDYDPKKEQVISAARNALQRRRRQRRRANDMFTCPECRQPQTSHKENCLQPKTKAELRRALAGDMLALHDPYVVKLMDMLPEDLSADESYAPNYDVPENVSPFVPLPVLAICSECGAAVKPLTLCSVAKGDRVRHGLCVKCAALEEL